jgi:hypothetical protein
MEALRVVGLLVVFFAGGFGLELLLFEADLLVGFDEVVFPPEGVS